MSADSSPVRSLEDIHASVPIPQAWWRRFLAFSGPAILVSVGYMDPGNWGTDLQAGSQFKYRLLWVLLLSNLMALLLQTLATRLGVVTGRDLAQACREAYPRRTVWGLWGLTEVAIAATDLAEVIGTIIGLKLLFGVPYLWGLAIAAGDTFLLLALQRKGVRLIELLTLALVAVIAGSFVFEIVLAKPHAAEVLRGLVPGLDAGNRRESLYVAIGMLGATVMPHNLYLHSALVQTRAFPQDEAGKRLACKYNFFDSLTALNGAFFVNAAILVLAAATFYPNKIDDLQEAHKMLGELWGIKAAAVLFALALLASGQSSTLTGTLAGQVVMEGFIRLRLRPWARRLLTRSAALVPALLVVSLTSTGRANSEEEAKLLNERLMDLLVFSQVTLSFQLPFAVIPLVQLTSDPRRMGAFVNGPKVQVLAWASAVLVVGLNFLLVFLQADKWANEAGERGWLVYTTVAALALAVGGFLGWVTLCGWRARRAEERPAAPALPPLPSVQYRRIGVAVEFASGDATVLTQAAALARAHGAPLVLLHVVEGLGAEYHGPATADLESTQDRADLDRLVAGLAEQGLPAEGRLGYGTPYEELVRIAGEEKLDLLVLGSHGHRLLADLALGATVSPVLHRLPIPVLVVPTGAA
jgi:manganese transport protein